MCVFINCDEGARVVRLGWSGLGKGGQVIWSDDSDSSGSVSKVTGLTTLIRVQSSV